MLRPFRAKKIVQLFCVAPVTIQNDWRTFVVEGDNYQARVMLKPRFWSKIESASKDYPSWIAVITGKISKLKDNCFEMPQASAQVFEKKVKEWHLQ